MKHRRPNGVDLVAVPPRVEAALWRRLRFENEPRCRTQLFDRYRGLARSLAIRLIGRRPRHGIELGDAEQYAYEGLLQAIDRFDPLNGATFGGYARRRIIGSIADGAAQMCEVDAQHSFRRRLEQERARSLIDADAPSALAALSALTSGLAIGLMLEETGMVASADAADRRPNAYESLAWREMNALIAREITQLPEREAYIIGQHYECGVSFTQIASLLGLSKGRVTQLHQLALGRLQRRLRPR